MQICSLILSFNTEFFIFGEEPTFDAEIFRIEDGLSSFMNEINTHRKLNPTAMLMKDERLITQSSDNTITLTEMRIIQAVGNKVQTITLDKISCIKVQHVSISLFLVIGVPVLFFGVIAMMFGRDSEDGIISTLICVAGILFILLYFILRRHAVSIVADSGNAIEFLTKGMKDSDILEFVNKIDSAKSKFHQHQASRI